jgi:hypothetical protein
MALLAWSGSARWVPRRACPSWSRCISLVEVHFLEVVTRGESAVLALRWEATGPGGRLFPALDGEISLIPAGEHAGYSTLKWPHCSPVRMGLSRCNPPTGTGGAPSRRGPLGSAQPLVAMKYVLTMSPSTCAVSIEVKPASVSISWAFCSPHIVPRPIPPSARETVMQCMQETA